MEKSFIDWFFEEHINSYDYQVKSELYFKELVKDMRLGGMLLWVNEGYEDIREYLISRGSDGASLKVFREAYIEYAKEYKLNYNLILRLSVENIADNVLDFITGNKAFLEAVRKNTISRVEEELMHEATISMISTFKKLVSFKYSACFDGEHDHLYDDILELIELLSDDLATYLNDGLDIIYECTKDNIIGKGISKLRELLCGVNGLVGLKFKKYLYDTSHTIGLNLKTIDDDIFEAVWDIDKNLYNEDGLFDTVELCRRYKIIEDLLSKKLQK